MRVLEDKKFLSKEEYIEIAKENGKEIKKNIDEYNEKVTKNKQRISDLKKEIGEEKKKDIEVFVEKIEDLNKDINELEEKITDRESKTKMNESSLGKLKKEIKNLGNDLTNYNLISKLANLAVGKGGNYISFGRYVLGAYFQKVLVEANKRLQKMTSNRYTLFIKEHSKGTSLAGLDVEIYDSLTGKKRDIKTLSGGETFKALWL